MAAGLQTVEWREFSKPGSDPLEMCPSVTSIQMHGVANIIEAVPNIVVAYMQSCNISVLLNRSILLAAFASALLVVFVWPAANDLSTQSKANGNGSIEAQGWRSCFNVRQQIDYLMSKPA